MNRERILELADVIERTPHAKRLKYGAAPLKPTRFNMDTWHCGTSACIGGWAETIFFPHGESPTDAEIYDALGISRDVGYQLFYSLTSPDITPQQAAACLRNLAETGTVDWKKALAS